MKKIVLIGKNSQLGKTFINKYTDLNLISFGKDDMDIKKKDVVFEIINKYKPEIIINCSGFTNVYQAENTPKEAFEVNSKGPLYLANISEKIGALLIHFSTDYVFNGLKNSPYYSYDKTSPLNTYGMSKLVGEKNIINSGCNYYIIRISWLMSIYGENFIKTILKKIRSKHSLEIVSDQIGSPTSTDLVTDIMRKLIDLKFTKTKKIFHVSSKGEISWYDLSKFILELFPFKNKPSLLKKISSSSSSAKPIRPSYSVLAHEEIESYLNIKLPHWKKDMEPIISALVENE